MSTGTSLPTTTFLGQPKYCRPSNTVGHRFTESYLKRTIFDDTAISNVNELVVGNKIGTVTEKMS